MRLYRSLPTKKVSVDDAQDENDLVAIETALEVRLNNEFLATFVCSPGLEEELAIGHLFSTGIIDSFEDISKMRYSGNRCFIKTREDVTPKVDRGFSQVRRFIGTECSAPEILRELRTADGIPSMTKMNEIDLSDLFIAADLLRQSQAARRKTGAFHGALVQSLDHKQHVITEDLGRHNAVDKAIGSALKQKFDLTNCLLISSGRLTADVVSKCAWTSIPLLVSFAVSTDAGVKFAQKANLTLVGALKGKRMRVYNLGACKIVNRFLST